MNKIIKNCRIIIIISITVSLLAASLQITVPYLISSGIKATIQSDPNPFIIPILALTFFCKAAMQGCSETLNQFLEAKIRLSIIEHISTNDLSNDKGKLATLIKEESGRVASSVIQVLELTASGCLTLATFILLTFENYFMAGPLLVFFALSYFYITFSANKVSNAYKLEIEQEQKYKSSIIHLKHASSAPLPHFILKAKINNYHLKKSIKTRYRYEWLSISLTSGPEIFVAVIIAMSLLLIAFLSPMTLGPDLIYYLGYIGMFALGANHSIHISLSLIGTKNSITRIFKGV